ncbi:SDR family oxidoreductase [Paenibacillus doosanensis]|uniref:Oxidoreductase n=1 Tax=Paenibacillus konkukensis TaxID=2020716 RepID=A0ABY4RQM6_9BACL|nr:MULTISPECIES: SDR family oxidoreductase [Paenibacillus]MCS7461391.1 SDR family oxidoreductase [Paenibacillus doosanensis]UQZ83662.1 putative oxidoreductase [Paenibacillus konkukensis]
MKHKIALVTGGVRGIGEAIGKELARCGYIAYAASRRASEGYREGNWIHLPMDLRKEGSVEEAFDLIAREHGALDVLVNNAAVMINGPFEQFQPKAWEDTFETNVYGPIQCMKRAFPLMKENGGRIINISSIMTEKPLPQSALYTASKHALNGMGEALAEEWHPHRIFLTKLCLGATYTDLWAEAEGFTQDDMLHVEDAARAAAFIAQTPLHVRIDEITMTPPKGVI